MRYAERCAEQRRRLDRAAAEVVAVCRDVPGVEAVYAFGSYATGPSDRRAISIYSSSATRRCDAFYAKTTYVRD